MAERRSTRTKRRPDDDELARLADDVFTEEPEDEADEGAEDEVADEPEDEAAEEPKDEADEGAEDELADEPEDEAAEEPEDEADEFEDAAEEDEDEMADDLEDEAAEEDDSEQVGRRPRRSRNGLTAAKAGQAALRQITELTGKDAEGVTGVERTDDGSWQVGVEVVEDRRIPSSTDILATYDTLIDEDGELVSYRRVRRYSRGRGDDGDA